MSSGDAAPKDVWLHVGPGRLIVLSGPSGVGKDTVLKRMFEYDPTLRYSVSYTTRAPRADEKDGVSYSFVDEATFRAMAERGELLEWEEVHGRLYGTSLQRVSEAVQRSEDIVLKIEVHGAARVRRRVSGAIFVFLLPPSEAVLRQRLRERDTEDSESLEQRMHRAAEELAEAVHYDHQVINDDVDRAAQEILTIINQERRAAAVSS